MADRCFPCLRCIGGALQAGTVRMRNWTRGRAEAATKIHGPYMCMAREPAAVAIIQLKRINHFEVASPCSLAALAQRNPITCPRTSITA